MTLIQPDQGQVECSLVDVSQLPLRALSAWRSPEVSAAALEAIRRAANVQVYDEERAAMREKLGRVAGRLTN